MLVNHPRTSGVTADLLLRRLRKRQLQTSNNDKCLGERDEDVTRCLDPDVDTLGRRVIDVVLEHACVHHGDGRKHETHEDTGSRVKVDLVLSQEGIHNN